MAKNLSDFPGKPPYKVGDLVTYVQADTPLLKHGDRLVVTKVTWNRTQRKWLIEVRVKLEDTLHFSYLAESFIPWEPTTLYIVFDISDNPRLNPDKFNLDLILFADKSLVVAREYAREEMRRDPSIKLGIFSLFFVAEFGE
jgi:hypothetical protein